MRVAPVSVVIPCYRCTGTIERAVRSVATQSQRPAELLLVDDASPDDTVQLLESLRERFGTDWIRIVRLSSNQGPASARNAGWDAATQPFVAFLDSDDAWHPRKIEIQWSWMQEHPEFAVTGHAARRLAPGEGLDADPGFGEAQPVASRAFFASNQFITPSVMLRRDLPQRFETGKRHMEDYLLWLEIAVEGRKIARLPHVLAYTFKAAYGEAGLSSDAWKMELGELAAFASLRRKGAIGAGYWLLLSGYSLLKFMRRGLMLATGYSPGGTPSKPAMLYAAAYVVMTQAMTALLVIAGVSGNSEIAADIGVVQAATLATFFAFSGNARNLILTERGQVSHEMILAARMALVLPLGAAAGLLCAIVGHVDLLLALVLVLRRAVEWIDEIRLSESELVNRRTVARNSLFLQLLLLLLAACAVITDSPHMLWVLAAWALVPAIPLVRHVAGCSGAAFVSLRDTLSQLLPHFGATAASGMSLYAFRALLVLVAGKTTAGILFAAFAIGSFPGSVFANVLGPTVSLHQERSGRPHLPRTLWLAVVLYLLCGTALLGLTWAAPQLLASFGKSGLFWSALGWSLLGGVTMIIAQRMRLKLLALNAGSGLFGSDVLIHVYLIAAVPALYAVGGVEGLPLLYFLNAALAVLFYSAGARGEAAAFESKSAERAAFALVFLLFLPLFFLVSGKIFNPVNPLVDSGGVLRNLPLPVSLLACSGGLLLFGRYSMATPALWTIFGLLLLMLISTAVAGGNSGELDRAKMLLLLQVVLPAFGLVLGMVIDSRTRYHEAMCIAIVAVVAIVVPAQLIATWAHGARTLGHSVFLFGVYQHLQFVPVILVCAYWLALQGLWDRWGVRGRLALAFLLAWLAIYAVASHSFLAIVAIAAGLTLFGYRYVVRRREFSAAATLAAAFACFATYHVLVTETDEYKRKFSFMLTREEQMEFVSVASHTEAVSPHWMGGWRIVEAPVNNYIMVLGVAETTLERDLLVEGELDQGSLSFEVQDKARTALSRRAVAGSPGPFSVRIRINPAAGHDEVWIRQLEPGTRGVIRTMRWKLPSGSGPQGSEWRFISRANAADGVDAKGANASEKGGLDAVRNISERFGDWGLFGRGIMESPKIFFFGHAKPLAREQRTSAHNFYIDFAYNFGVLALLPLLGLIFYTAMLLWRSRQEVFATESLLLLAAVVAFLVLVESNLKVSLRQPYPGIAIYFLWGLLLARLRAGAGKPAA